MPALRAIDLFCGAGGFTTGLKAAGFDVRLGVDIDAGAIGVYRANHPEHRGEVLDVSDVEATVALARAAAPDLDLVAGSSPCQDFSMCGNQTEAGRASLTVDFARVVAGLAPPAFVLENVPTIVNTAAYAELCTLLRDAGYSITTLVLNAKYRGTARRRRRARVRHARGASAAARPGSACTRQRRGKREARVTVRDVLGPRCGDYVWVAPRNRFFPGVLSVDRVYPTLRSHRGKCLERPPAAYQARYEDAGPVGEAFVLDEAAAAAIASFPASYTWPCRRVDAGVYIGNCVPPQMAATVGRALLEAGLFCAAGRPVRPRR